MTSTIPPGQQSPPIGGLPAPPGAIPNFVDPPSLDNVVVATCVLGLVLGTLSLAIRVYTKLFIIKSHGWEDYTAVFAWLGFLPYTAVAFVSLRYSSGAHQWNVTVENIVQWAKIASIDEILYSIIIVPAKVSILLQFILLFIPNRRSTGYYLIQVMIWVNVVFFTTSLFLTIFQCSPRAKQWNPLLPGHCINYGIYLIASAAFNLISDFCILLIPIAWVWRLQMSRWRKVGVSAVFTIGILACVTTVLRLYYAIQYISTLDATYAYERVALCTIGEIAAAILCANVPSTPRFFAHVSSKAADSFGSYFRSTPQRITSKSSGGGSGPKNSDKLRWNGHPNPLSFKGNDHLDMEERGGYLSVTEHRRGEAGSEDSITRM